MTRSFMTYSPKCPIDNCSIKGRKMPEGFYLNWVMILVIGDNGDRMKELWL
jgi:hypothetical protein